MTFSIRAAWIALLFAIVATPGVSAQRGRKPAPAPSVTLTGCLDIEGTRFRLVDVEGAQAPKGRSWKTAFITKSTKDMDVVGASSAVRLKDHVGHKITVTGARSGDKQLTARAIKHVAPSCS
jgi:hypothetical protein